YLSRRRHHGLDRYFVFNPGQNTIWDLTDKRGAADEEYIDRLVAGNPFAVALGADGPSNPVIRQNHKPFYGVRELLAVNRALARQGAAGANKYSMLTPEVDLLEAVEARALFVPLPVPWRDYGAAVNPRVTKEETTLATDEGLLFDPPDSGFDVPLRCAEVERLLARWSLTSMLPSGALGPLIWRILAEDPEVVPLVPALADRWAADFDRDPELVQIAQVVRAVAGDEPVTAAVLRDAARRLAAAVPG